MMPSKNEQIGLRIKELREKNNITIKAFAEQVHSDNSTIGKIEKGKMGLPLPTLLEICSIFKVSADWILNGNDSTPISAPETVTKAELLIKIYEATLNTKAIEKANAEMIKTIYRIMAEVPEAKVNSWHAVLVERFLSEE